MNGREMDVMLLKLIFFSCLALCAYVYFGYPLLLAALVAVRRRPVRRENITPLVSVIIAAYNEKQIIAEKLENTLSLDYPEERLDILVVSDGSTDGTEAIVRRYEKRGVRLLRLPRWGKARVLNQAAAQAQGEILVFTDANAVFDSQAVRRLVSNFADPEVGGVCGNQQYRRGRGGDSAGEGENLYWTYDKWIKRLESQLGSAIAADGSIYAVRKRLFVPIADPAQADDFAVSARVVTQGYRLIFDPEAISYEPPPTSSQREFWRKVRVTNHSLRAIFMLGRALNPRHSGFYAVELLSHKVLRYLVPFFLLLAFAANVALARGSGFYQWLLLGQALFYGSAWVGYQARHLRWGRMKLFYAPLYFCLANAAALLGALSLLKGERITVWQPHREGPQAQEKGGEI